MSEWCGVVSLQRQALFLFLLLHAVLVCLGGSQVGVVVEEEWGGPTYLHRVGAGMKRHPVVLLSRFVVVGLE
jgi:hypothetical protein